MTFIGKKTSREIAAALGITERAVRDRASRSRENWRSVKMSVRGGKQKFYMGSFLPTDVKQAIASSKTEETGLALIKADAKPVSIPNVDAPDKSKKIGLAKYNLVHAYRREMDAADWGQKQEAGGAFMLAYNAQILMPNVFNVIGKMNEKTVQALDKKLKDAGDDYTELCDGRGGWKKHGTTKYRGRDLPREAQEAFLQCYLQPSRPSKKLAIRAARQVLANKNIPDDCSDSTYRRWLGDYGLRHAHVICLGRYGQKAYMDKFCNYITRDASVLNVGDCLVADGKDLNFTILHPMTAKPARMALIIFMDWASRCPVGWQIMPVENTIAIAAAFRHACVTLGMYPKVVYTDNGKAFKAHFFHNKDTDFSEMNGLYARVGTAVQFAAPYNGRAKVVERLNQTIQSQLECLMPSFCGDAVHLKPAHMNRNETFMQAYHKMRTEGYVPTLREANSAIASYFSFLVREPHSQLYGRTPLEVLEEGRGPGIDPMVLNHDFLWREERQVRRCRVTLNNIEYESDCLHGIDPAIKVRLMYDMSDLRNIYCYMPDGQYLGEAQPVAMLHPLAKLMGDELSLYNVQEATKQHRRLLRSAKQALLRTGAHKEDVEALHSLSYNPKVSVPNKVNGVKEIGIEEPPMSEEEVDRLNKLAEEEKLKEATAPQIGDGESEEEEALRLKGLVEKEKEQTHTTAPERLEYFESDKARYDWAFHTKYEHRSTLQAKDEEFMTRFEATAEYRDRYRTHYEGLKEIYDMCKNELKQA